MNGLIQGMDFFWDSNICDIKFNSRILYHSESVCFLQMAHVFYQLAFKLVSPCAWFGLDGGECVEVESLCWKRTFVSTSRFIAHPIHEDNVDYHFQPGWLDVNLGRAMKVNLEFSGGAELLVGKKKKHDVELPEKDEWTLEGLLAWVGSFDMNNWTGLSGSQRECSE